MSQSIFFLYLTHFYRYIKLKSTEINVELSDD